jgi:hypothetical protein
MRTREQGGYGRSMQRTLSFLVPLAISAMVALVAGALSQSSIEEVRPFLVAALLSAGVALLAVIALWLQRPSNR